FFGNYAPLANAQAFATYLAPMRKTEWVVYSKRPFGGPEAVLAYLSRYTCLEVLRAWWKAARPQGWLFPGRDPVKPMTTRQLNRACHAAAQLAALNKRVSLHTIC